MFKRRFGHRPRSKKLETRAHANRAYKRKVTNKVININVKCQEICTLPGATCPNGGKHILVASAELFGQTISGYQDALRIARLEGVLWVRPDYRQVANEAGSCLEALAILRNPTIFRMGLLKSRAPQVLGGVPTAVNPLADGVDPFHLADAVDSRFLKTWDHLFTVDDQVFCGQTTMPISGWKAPGYVVPPIIAGESTGYLVPPDVCDVCEDQVSGTDDGQTLILPRWHALRVSYRRPIVMKENDTLDLWYGWEKVRGCPEDLPRDPQPPLQWLGHVFMTIET